MQHLRVRSCVCVCSCVCVSLPPDHPRPVRPKSRIPPALAHEPHPPYPHPYPQAIARPTPGTNYPLKSAREVPRVRLSISGVKSGANPETPRKRSQLGCRKWGCNKWELKGCLAALAGNRPKSAFFALFLPFSPFSGGCEEHLGNPENRGKRPFSSDILRFA